MNRFILLLGTMASFIVFFIVTSNGQGFGKENAAMEQTEMEILLNFSKNDKGKKKAEPKEMGKWKKITQEEVDAVVGSEEPYEIKAWKINPCYVCSGGQCYVKNPC